MKILAILFLLTSCGFKIVDEGHVGIETRLGKVVGEENMPGLHFYNPLTSTIVTMEVREQRHVSKATSYTKDVQTATIEYSLNYRPDATFMVEFFKAFGYDWFEKIVPPIAEAKIKEVIGQYEASPLVADRRKASDAIKEHLVEKMKERNIFVTNFEITGIDYNNEFERSVEQKVIAKERALEEQNRSIQVKEQAEQKLTMAKAEAESIRIKAQALSSNAKLVELNAVDKWDGKLPQYMTGAVPFLNLGAQK